MCNDILGMFEEIPSFAFAGGEKYVFNSTFYTSSMWIEYLHEMFLGRLDHV